jgi:hypothetical protein
MNTSAQIRPHPNREPIERTFELGYGACGDNAVVTQLTPFRAAVMQQARCALEG